MLKEEVEPVKSTGWEEEFDNHYQDMDVWVYMDQANDPHGISSKIMNGKQEVKDFISSLLQSECQEDCCVQRREFGFRNVVFCFL